ncbi:RagB/SusD family nutrient uptake outer membrane protein [Rhizosphaericola mali]|uniref:RagB/SusD family nutrient uptake outer membrane protein n=2 Tax=Rhizosphaericola mali TaxID=2545455 RepID=A0A5P2G897_9BACT|nr:RagB/SusD family nutrient uptake outer membrane protein [Rhizosphaericola mali]
MSIFLFSSCEKKLEPSVYSQLSQNNFFNTASDAKAAVTSMYSGMLMGNTYEAGWGGSNNGWLIQSSMETDETICSWGWPGWKRMNDLQFSIDDGVIVGIYTAMMPFISQITIDISKIQDIAMDTKLKNQYIAELRALRAHYSQILYNFYGPVPIRLDPVAAADPTATPIPRPSHDTMVQYIENDYKAAAAVLPNSFTGSDYGRFSKSACLVGLMKLYMKEHRWSDAVTIGEQIKSSGFSLISDYSKNFSYDNKGGNSEIILAIPCNANATRSYNNWLANVLPSAPAYVDPSGMNLQEWGGYKMPWTTYDKFETNDKRLSVLFRRYAVDAAGTLFDAKTGGTINGTYYASFIGAIPKKYGVDPTSTTSYMGTDIVVWRYADVELLLAEALNEVNHAPTADAYSLINDVRTRAGVTNYNSGSLDYTSFKSKIMDERLFELWCEGQRREDMIRWGTFVSYAASQGSAFATANDTLYPLPQKVITETNGIVKQNPGY